MGRSNGRSCLALLLALLLTSCISPEQREVVHPPREPDKPLPELVYDNYFTPRGTEVQAPGYIVNRDDLFVLALQEIDNLNFHLRLPRWIVRVVPPDGKEVVNSVLQRITVRWRPDDYEPRDVMLPNLEKLMDQSIAR
jgi:hypothetical protein